MSELLFDAPIQSRETDERAIAAVARLTDEEVAALNAARSMTPLTLHMVVATMIRVHVAAARAASLRATRDSATTGAGEGDG